MGDKGTCKLRGMQLFCQAFFVYSKKMYLCMLNCKNEENGDKRQNRERERRTHGFRYSPHGKLLPSFRRHDAFDASRSLSDVERRVRLILLSDRHHYACPAVDLFHHTAVCRAICRQASWLVAIAREHGFYAHRYFHAVVCR